MKRTWTIIGVADVPQSLNPSTGTTEFLLRDPDGYYVTISALNPASPLLQHNRRQAEILRSD
jgi:hypothetical protein